jgi:hypothetical protein
VKYQRKTVVLIKMWDRTHKAHWKSGPDTSLL